PEEKLTILKSYYAMPLKDEEMIPHLRNVTTPVNLKMVAKLSEIYREHLHYKLNASTFAKIVEEIQSDKATYALEGEQEDDPFSSHTDEEDDHNDDPLVK